jgi:hypothetical protein
MRSRPWSALALLALVACDGCTGKTGTSGRAEPLRDDRQDGTGGASCVAASVEELRACIAALADRGGTVVLEAGEYSLSRHVHIPHSGIHVRGEGSDATRVAIADGACQGAFVIGALALEVEHLPPVENVSIRNLSIDGNKAGNPCCETYVEPALTHLYVNAISVFNARNVSIADVTIRDARSGGIVTDRGVRNLVISNVVIRSSAWDAVALYQTRNSRVQDSLFERNAAAGISLDWYADGNVFSGNLLLRNGAGEQGLDISTCPTVLLATASPGIFSAGCSDNVFVNNVIAQSGSNGVQLGIGSDKETGSSRNYLGRNVLRQNAEFGVWLVGNASRENVAVGTLYSGNGARAVLLTATASAAAEHYLDVAAYSE